MLDTAQPFILIVDDNPQNVQFLGNVLTENSYELAIAMDGKQALDFLQKKVPDLILLDIMMPVMDGYEVCRRVKQMQAIKDIPIIFLSAKTETEDLVKGFEAGAVDFVTKPFSTAELLVRIKTHVELKRARDEIHLLRGIIPICAGCKNIRDDEGFWNQIETYIERHSKAQFSHGLCPDCAEEMYGGEKWFKNLQKKRGMDGSKNR